MNATRGGNRRAGFTLIELMLVVALIAVTFAIALPRLWPAIAWGEHEGAARRLANYGRAAVAETTLFQEHYTINIDLENQEYWTVRWPGYAPEFDNLEPTMEDMEGMGGGLENMSEADLDRLVERGERMSEQMERFARLSQQGRLRNVKRDGILADLGNLFESEFRLDDEEEVAEEVTSGFLQRISLPEGVTIDAVRVSGTEKRMGTVEIDVTPLGFSESVTFHIRNRSDDYYTVRWDPITGGAHIRPGRE